MKIFEVKYMVLYYICYFIHGAISSCQLIKGIEAMIVHLKQQNNQQHLTVTYKIVYKQQRMLIFQAAEKWEAKIIL